MAEKIQALYEDLERIAGQFSGSADFVEQRFLMIKEKYEAVRTTWEGRGANAFFSEMDSEVFTALGRLKRTLEEAATVTRTVATTLGQAEEEASGHFAK